MTPRFIAMMAAVMFGLCVVPVLASGPTPPPAPTPNLTPEERMQRRYPQPVKVGDLIGLPLLDEKDRMLGRITAVVRTDSGKLILIVPYGGTFGFGKRLVAVPIEVVAIAGRQLASLDMDRAAFDGAPPWSEAGARALEASETVRVALYKR